MASVAHRQAANDRWWLLAWLLTALLVLVVAHDLDHIVDEERQGGLVDGFWIVLPFQYAGLALMTIGAWRRTSWAPTVAALGAAIAVLGFVGAHVVPFGPQPFGEYDVGAITWGLVAVPTVVALAALVVALRLRAAERAGDAMAVAPG